MSHSLFFVGKNFDWAVNPFGYTSSMSGFLYFVMVVVGSSMGVGAVQHMLKCGDDVQSWRSMGHGFMRWMTPIPNHEGFEQEVFWETISLNIMRMRRRGRRRQTVARTVTGRLIILRRVPLYVL